jgi:hypothetical protein
MAPRTEFSTEQVRNKARKDLLYMLEGVRIDHIDSGREWATGASVAS